MAVQITHDMATHRTTVTEEDGTAHTLSDSADIGHGSYPLYHYPGIEVDTGAVADGGIGLVRVDPGHVTYTPDGQSVLRHDPERLYGRDGTVKGAVYVGDVIVG